MVQKKIGIITIHNSPNYGASLQSFALFYFLKNEGYDCQVIDLARPIHADFIKSKRYTQLITNVKPSLFSRVKTKIKTILNKQLSEDYSRRYANQLMLRKNLFDRFNAQVELSLRFRCIDELYENPPLYDIYITGSDQVWNPGNNYAVEPYFLTFVKNSSKKIAYAPSFGISILPEEVKNNYRDWISRYDCLSVREEEGKKIIEGLTGKKVEVVLDPTFLLDISYWHSIAIKPEISGKYIFCFILNKNDELLSYVQKIKAESGYDLVVISQNFSDAKSSNYHFIIDAGPEEFLGLIENAEIVFSDSFHATVFSIMLSKNFFTCILPGNRRGSRITNLLNIFCLSEHLLNQSLNQSGAELLKHQINRPELIEKISFERKRSIKFLKNAIGS